jgi:hypothetical protein
VFNSSTSSRLTDGSYAEMTATLSLEPDTQSTTSEICVRKSLRRVCLLGADSDLNSLRSSYAILSAIP